MAQAENPSPRALADTRHRGLPLCRDSESLPGSVTRDPETIPARPLGHDFDAYDSEAVGSATSTGSGVNAANDGLILPVSLAEPGRGISGWGLG